MARSLPKEILIWISGALFLAVSLGSLIVAQIGNHNWTSYYGSGNSGFNIPGHQGACVEAGCTVSYKPDHIEKSTLALITAVGILSIIGIILAAYFVFRSALYKTSLRSIIVVGVIGTILPFVAFVYSMAMYYESDRGQWGYFDEGSSNGTYTVESWSCVLKDVNSFYNGGADEFSSVCSLSMTARWLTVPLFVFAAIFYTLVTLVQFQKQKHNSSEATQTDQKGKSSTIAKGQV